MKFLHYLFFIFILLLFFQCKSKNTNIIESNTIEREVYNPTNLIGEQLNTSREKEIESEYGFITIDSFQMNLQNGEKLEIIVEKINGWDDPGDFHRIRVKRLGKVISFFNMDGWMIVGSYELQYLPSFSNSDLLNSNYVIAQKSSSKDIVLIAFGYVYASIPGVLSIFNLSRFDKPEMIFNDNFYLYSYEDKNSDGNIDIVVTKYDKDEMNNKDDFNTYLLINGCYQSDIE